LSHLINPSCRDINKTKEREVKKKKQYATNDDAAKSIPETKPTKKKREK
jgi:hypothetical protein